MKKQVYISTLKLLDSLYGYEALRHMHRLICVKNNDKITFFTGPTDWNREAHHKTMTTLQKNKHGIPIREKYFNDTNYWFSFKPTEEFKQLLRDYFYSFLNSKPKDELINELLYGNLIDKLSNEKKY